MTLVFAGLAVLAYAAAAPANADPATTRAVPVGAFSGVQASEALAVTVTTGAPSVTLVGDPRYFDRVQVRVTNGTLRLSRVAGGTWHWGGWRDEVKVRVTAPTLSSVEASSAADITVRAIEAGGLSLTASSGADLVIDGKCGALTATASSGADVHAEKLICNSATARASSGADVIVFATASASGDASSGGDVLIRGPARIGDTSESSGGDVTIRR